MNTCRQHGLPAETTDGRCRLCFAFNSDRPPRYTGEGDETRPIPHEALILGVLCEIRDTLKGIEEELERIREEGIG